MLLDSQSQSITAVQCLSNARRRCKVSNGNSVPATYCLCNPFSHPALVFFVWFPSSDRLGHLVSRRCANGGSVNVTVNAQDHFAFDRHGRVNAGSRLLCCGNRGRCVTVLCLLSHLSLEQQHVVHVHPLHLAVVLSVGHLGVALHVATSA